MLHKEFGAFVALRGVSYRMFASKEAEQAAYADEDEDEAWDDEYKLFDRNWPGTFQAISLTENTMIYYKLKAWYWLHFLKTKAWLLTARYKFRHWLFRWNVDEENDLTFSVANVIHFIKYKEHTIIKWGRRDYALAPKYVTKN